MVTPPTVVLLYFVALTVARWAPSLWVPVAFQALVVSALVAVGIVRRILPPSLGLGLALGIASTVCITYRVIERWAELQVEGGL